MLYDWKISCNFYKKVRSSKFRLAFQGHFIKLSVDFAMFFYRSHLEKTQDYNLVHKFLNFSIKKKRKFRMSMKNKHSINTMSAYTYVLDYAYKSFECM